jgi:hypothetical protein
MRHLMAIVIFALFAAAIAELTGFIDYIPGIGG